MFACHSVANNSPRPAAGEMREMQRVESELVVHIRLVEWTAEGRLRHVAFLALRNDMETREVRRE